MPERGRGMRDPQPDVGGQRLGLLVEHDEGDEPAWPARAHQAADFRMPQQVVADLFDRLELRRTPIGRDEDVRVAALEGVVVAYVPEVAYPAVDAEQVERGRRDEVDRPLVGAEVLA